MPKHRIKRKSGNSLPLIRRFLFILGGVRGGSVGGGGGGGGGGGEVLVRCLSVCGEDVLWLFFNRLAYAVLS